MLKIRINDEKYNQDVPKKIASRGLIIKDGLVGVLHSKKFNAYITPGGGVEGNETLEETCIREVKEETGLVVKPISLIAQVDVNYPRIRIEHNYFICDFVEDLAQVDQTEYEKEQDLEVVWLSYEDIKKAYAITSGFPKYDVWMQREFIVIAELSKYLNKKSN